MKKLLYYPIALMCLMTFILAGCGEIANQSDNSYKEDEAETEFSESESSAEVISEKESGVGEAEGSETGKSEGSETGEAEAGVGFETEDRDDDEAACDFYEDEERIEFDANNAFSYITTPTSSIEVGCEFATVRFSFVDGIVESDNDYVYLFEFATYEKEDVNGKYPMASLKKSRDVEFMFKNKDRYLFSRFAPAVLYNGEYVLLSNAQYVTNPEVMAGNMDEYPVLTSKKGVLLDSDTIGQKELTDLNVKRVVYNIPLSLIIGESTNPECPTIEYWYNGQMYHFNGYLCAGYDKMFSYLTQNGYHSTAIILNDWNRKNPQMMHPLSRKRNGRAKYYAFNTEEEEGVRLMEATAKFLAQRYTCGEYGMVHDWVIANEVNQQGIWNYMATSDLNYYADSFEKSFRTFYNAIRANYSRAHVYFSVDHEWNSNGGNNAAFFNARDFIYKFSEKAQRGGNYDWALSIHPYPSPLSKTAFWYGNYDKSEYAYKITPMNLSAVTDMMQKQEFLDTWGNVRYIGITELGFSSRAGQKLQAAAFAYCYYIIEDNEYIDSFLLNRQYDDWEALRSGLALGIYSNDYSPKYILDVFRGIDTPDGYEYLGEMLQTIGADSLEEALEWAR